MCVGELTWKKDNKSVLLLIISGVLLFVEITLVGTKANSGDDRSMYFILPVFMFFLVLCFKDWNPRVDTGDYGGISTAIYVMQFGIITLSNKLIDLIHLEGIWIPWVIWLLVISIPTVTFILIKRTRIAKWIF